MNEQKIDADGRYVIEPDDKQIIYELSDRGIGIMEIIHWVEYKSAFKLGNCFVNYKSAQRELDLRILIQDIRSYCATVAQTSPPVTTPIRLNNALIDFYCPIESFIDLFKQFQQRIDAANAPFDWRGE